LFGDEQAMNAIAIFLLNFCDTIPERAAKVLGLAVSLLNSLSQHGDQDDRRNGADNLTAHGAAPDVAPDSFYPGLDLWKIT
jgi:hypothetical protein